MTWTHTTLRTLIKLNQKQKLELIDLANEVQLLKQDKAELKLYYSKIEHAQKALRFRLDLGIKSI